MKFKIHRKLEEGQAVRVVAFGSSNTQRRQAGMHWFDYVELGFKNMCCSCGQFINSGIGGNTTIDLLERYDNELARYEPDLVIITIGGNDSNPDENIDDCAFRDKLRLLHKKITDSGSEIILQTYYSCDLEQMDRPHAENFLRYMQIIRDIGKEFNSPVVDHLSRWEKLRLHDLALYRSLMNDAMHVNTLGNMVLGLDLMDFFGLELSEELRGYCREGLIVKSYLDSL